MQGDKYHENYASITTLKKMNSSIGRPRNTPQLPLFPPVPSACMMPPVRSSGMPQRAITGAGHFNGSMVGKPIGFERSRFPVELRSNGTSSDGSSYTVSPLYDSATNGNWSFNPTPGLEDFGTAYKSNGMRSEPDFGSNNWGDMNPTKKNTPGDEDFFDI